MLTQNELDTLLASAPQFATIRKTVAETEWRVKVYSASGARIESADCFETSKQAALDSARAMGLQIFETMRAGCACVSSALT